jgi:hypothetical protein
VTAYRPGGEEPVGGREAVGGQPLDGRVDAEALKLSTTAER